MSGQIKNTGRERKREQRKRKRKRVRERERGERTKQSNRKYWQKRRRRQSLTLLGREILAQDTQTGKDITFQSLDSVVVKCSCPPCKSRPPAHPSHRRRRYISTSTDHEKSTFRYRTPIVNNYLFSPALPLSFSLSFSIVSSFVLVKFSDLLFNLTANNKATCCQIFSLSVVSVAYLCFY